MIHLSTTLACITLALGAVALPALASSTATSSLADSLATSVGSISDSVKGSSNSSSRATGVAEGDYKLIQVAAGDQPGHVTLTLQAVADASADGEVLLTVPQKAYDQSGLTQDLTVSARHRPYGVEFANGQTRQAFFLALTNDWYRELQNQPVRL